MIKSASFSTDMVESRFRNDLLRTAMRPLYEIILTGDQPNYQLSGSASLRTSGLITIGTTTFNTQSYIRTRSIIAQGGLDLYVIQLLTSGELEGDFNGRTVSAKPGDILVIDLAKTVSSRAQKGSRITVFIPREELERVIGWRNLHGLILPGSAPMTRLLFNYLRGLNEVSGELSVHDAADAHNGMMTLLSSGIMGHEDQLEDQVTINLPMRNRILAFIEENLCDGNLGPSKITQHFHVSRSHLYRSFENDGGIAKIIREKRLDRAYRILVENRHRTISFKELAYRCGFNDPILFSKGFRNRFGMSPRDAREIGAPLMNKDLGKFSYTQYLSDHVGKEENEHARF
ncbi:MAG: helix-turn-helix domain-containing protein [Brucella intermedia]